MEEITGKIINIIYKAENGFKILNLETKGSIITIKGNMPVAEIGDMIKCEGKYIVHKDFGKQFEAIKYEKVLPEASDGILSYLESGTIKGIGPKTAQKIVERFGDDTLNIIQRTPELLSEIRGISKAKAIEIGNEFREKMEFFDIVDYLNSYNLSINDINKIYTKYKSQTIDIISENPYIILVHIPTAKFSEIDKIAISEGISLNSEHRLKSAITHAMTLSSKNGHTYVKKENLIQFVKNIASAEEEYIEKCLMDLHMGKFLNIYNLDEIEIVSLEPYYIAESEIAENLYTLGLRKGKKDFCYRF